MAIDRRAKFTTRPGEIEGIGLSIPNSLKSVVAKAPKTPEAINQYLKDLVANGTITADDATFLIDSEALQN
jgi:hypothetical protein